MLADLRALQSAVNASTSANYESLKKQIATLVQEASNMTKNPGKTIAPDTMEAILNEVAVAQFVLHIRINDTIDTSPTDIEATLTCSSVALTTELEGLVGAIAAHSSFTVQTLASSAQERVDAQEEITEDLKLIAADGVYRIMSNNFGCYYRMRRTMFLNYFMRL